MTLYFVLLSVLNPVGDVRRQTFVCLFVLMLYVPVNNFSYREHLPIIRRVSREVNIFCLIHCFSIDALPLLILDAYLG